MTADALIPTGAPDQDKPIDRRIAEIARDVRAIEAEGFVLAWQVPLDDLVEQEPAA